MSKQDDGLFLLEVLIDKIVFTKSPCFSDKDFRTCVNIECLSVEPLEICDDDPGVCVAKSGGPFVKNFNNGKSCLFSLKEAEITKAMTQFPVKVQVYKSLPCGCLPTKIVLGEATIDMTKEFVQARKKFLEDPNTVSYQALKDSFRLVAPEGGESGEIVMFIRISCFGKAITTRFQGGGGPPVLGSGGAGSSTIDRSCNPKKTFQTADDPCVCGAAKGSVSGRGGPCPVVQDPYNSTPCVDDPDYPCFCSGAKPRPPPPNMACRNTDQYCLHIPKGPLLCLPIFQELTEEQIRNLQKGYIDVDTVYLKKQLRRLSSNHATPITSQEAHCVQILGEGSKFHAKSNESVFYPYDSCSQMSLYKLKSKKRSVTFSETIDFVSQFQSDYSFPNYDLDAFDNTSFGVKETAVYMTFLNDFCHQKHSGTQATAAINKCMQVQSDYTEEENISSSLEMRSNYLPEITAYDNNRCQEYEESNTNNYDVYFSLKKKGGSGSRMGKKDSEHNSKSTTTCYSLSSTACQTQKSKGAAASTGTKCVSIKEDKPEELGSCPMTATVSHIRIGPPSCAAPCYGPKCIVASSLGEQAPVKVTTVTNPRRGVFELVVRRLTGAPLAKNELMLEWTPPPTRPPCAAPCTLPCSPSKYKMVVCRPPSCKPKCCKPKCCQPKCCRPKCCKKPCKKPCSPPPCKSCCKPCKIPCVQPCITPCCKRPCKMPCKSSPCISLCPVGRRKPRKTRSQPRIKAHKKRTSPCSNRKKSCPVVKCRSMPGPCISCFAPCPPRKCCSFLPCLPPRCCKSSCSSCC